MFLIVATRLTREHRSYSAHAESLEVVGMTDNLEEARVVKSQFNLPDFTSDVTYTNARILHCMEAT